MDGAIEGIKFEEAYRNLTTGEIGGLKIPVISMPDLIKNENAGARLQDVSDVERSGKILEMGKRRL